MRVTTLSLFVPALVSIAAAVSPADLVIEPEVHAQVYAGRARVLVALRLDESTADARRADAIERAQDAVVSRLPRSHAAVVRRYASVPLLALEIDVTALRALETMTDIVVSVRLDRPASPQ